MINKTYKSDVFCVNCGKIKSIEIPQELSVEDFLKQSDLKCKNCTYVKFRVYYMF